MTSPRYEIVEIRRIDRETGRFGGVFRTVFQAECVGHADRRLLTRSEEIEWRRSDLSYREAHLETKLQAAYDQILGFLLTRGWEPLGTNEGGRVTTLRRDIRRSITARLGRSRLGSDWLMFNGHWICRPAASARSEKSDLGTTGGLTTSPLPGVG